MHLSQFIKEKCARTSTDSFFAGSGFVGFCAFAQKHFDRVAPVRYGAVMIPCVFSFGVVDAFHFVAQSAAYRGNDADFAVRRTLKLALGLFLLPRLHHLGQEAPAGGHRIRYF